MKLFVLCLFVIVSAAQAEALKTHLIIDRVYQSVENRRAVGDSVSNYECHDFKGTYAGNKILVRPVTTGGSGRYQHTVSYVLGEGYVQSHGSREQKQFSVRHGNSVWVTLPELRADTPFVQQNIMLVTTDKRTGKMATSNLLFNVTRPIVLRKSRNPEFLKNECKEVYPAYASPIGVLTNSSTNPSQLMIKQGVQKLWTTLSGASWGFFFSPLSWTVVGNIFMINRNYFTQFSKQALETVEINSEYVLSPGDYVQIYEQRTRFVTAFDAYKVDVCGNSDLIDGEYMLQWWGVAYHAVPINPFEENSVPIESIGMYPQNSCSDRFTPEFSQSEDFNFVRTN